MFELELQPPYWLVVGASTIQLQYSSVSSNHEMLNAVNGGGPRRNEWRRAHEMLNDDRIKLAVWTL